MLVLKFGGSSVGTPERIKEVAKIVSEKLGITGPGVVVVSALSGVTDSLLKLCDLATRRDSGWNDELAPILRARSHPIKILCQCLDVCQPVACQAVCSRQEYRSNFLLQYKPIQKRWHARIQI